jgi:hypothetical protein
VAASGASFKVECGRCLLVFEAAAPKPAATTPLQSARVTPRPAPTPAATERALPPEELARALRPRRPDKPPFEQDPFERELRRIANRKRRILVGAGAAALVAIIAVAATQIRFSGLPRAAKERIEKAREKILRDDLQSLEEAGALFLEAARLAPGEAMPEAERAFALLLRAATHKDLADRLGAAGRDLNDRVAKLQTDKPQGYELQLAQLVQQSAQLVSEREPHVRDANRLLQEGVAAAKASLEDDPEDPAALRAMALWSALGDAPERGVRYLDQAAKKAPSDAFISWTRAALALTGAPSREKQDRALAALALAQKAEPRMLRAQVDVAAVSIDRQQPGPAREALRKILEQNSHHERARRLLLLLPALP